MPYCPDCGAQVNEYEQFCGECGADLSGEDGTHDHQQGGGNQQGGQQGRRQQGGQQGRRQQGGQQGRRQQGGQQGRRQQGGQQGRRQQGQRGQGQARRGGEAAGGRGQLPQETSGGFDFAIGYPKRDGWTPTLISSVLLFVSFLIVPAFIVYGYAFRVARSAALGRPNPPQYDDWGGLLVDGLRYFVVALVGGIAAAIVGGILVVGLGSVSDALGALAFFLVYLGAFWFVGAFLTAFVGSNSIGDAFTDGRAIELLKSGYYIKALLLYIGIAIVFQILTFVSFITIVGPIVVSAYALMAFGAYWGLVYYRAVQKGIVDPPVQDQQPARQTGQAGGARGQPRR